MWESSNFLELSILKEILFLSEMHLTRYEDYVLILPYW